MGPRRAAEVALVAIGLWLAGPGGARADEIDDFNRARNAWDTSNYAEAIRRFEPLLAEGPGGLTDQLLLRDARVYYAASLVMERHASDAEAQFELLLRQHPDYEIDPVAFPVAVVDIFRSVQGRIGAELQEQRARIEAERLRREEEERLRREEEERRRRAESAVYLERVVITRPPPVFMAIPFGVGQFINGQSAKGIAFLVVESTLLTLNLGSFLVHEAVRSLHLTSDNVGVNDTIADVSYGTNLVAFVGLIAAVGIGIADAVASFRGEEVRWRRVPRHDVPSRYRIGLGSHGLQVRF